MHMAKIARFDMRVIALALALGSAMAGLAEAQDEIDAALNTAGQADYETYCTPCHGPGGGPGTAESNGKPVDLRTIVAANGGRFPAGAWLNAITNPNPGRTHTAVWERIRRDQRSGPANLSSSRGVVAQIARYINSVQTSE